MLQLNSTSKKRLYKLLARCTAVLLAGLLYYLIVRITGKGIPCMYYTLTGFYCPGCGMTRMMMALMRLDFVAAFHYQPVFFCSLLPLGVCFGTQAFRYVKTGDAKLYWWQNVIIGIVIVALTVFCIYRNFA